MKLLVLLGLMIGSALAQLGTLPYKYTITSATSTASGYDVTVEIRDGSGSLKATSVVTLLAHQSPNVLRIRIYDLLMRQMELDAGSRPALMTALLNTYAGGNWAGGSSEGASGAVDWTNVTNKPSTFAPASHSHPESDVTSLTSDLAGKAAASHTHAISDVTNLQTSLNGKAASAHTHPESDVTNLATDLASKASSSHTHAESDVTNLVADLSGKAANSHTHSASDVNAGILAIGRIPTGQTSSTVPFGNDARFTDSRTPLSHTHPESDVTNLTTDLTARAQKIASGSATFTTTAVAASACQTTVTVAATNALTTDAVDWSYRSAPVATTDMRLTMNVWITANNVNFARCNNTAASVTPTALVASWIVLR